MSNDCRIFRDQIADFVTGVLPEPDSRELQKHLNTCAPCRDYLRALQQEDASLAKHFAQIDEGMAHRQERALQMIECSRTNEKRNTMSLWRRIMENRYSKLATAAAVIVIAAVSLVVFDRTTTPVYALGDLPAAFDRAHVIHVQGWQYFPFNKRSDGTSIEPVALEWWLDLENGRMRQTQVGMMQSSRMSSHGVESNTTVTVKDTICNGPYMMILDHGGKTATFMRLSDFCRQLMTYQQSRLLWSQLCAQPARLDDFVKTGQEDIDGVKYDIWQLDSAGGMGGIVAGGGGGGGGWSSGGTGSAQGGFAMPALSMRSRLWIATDTGQLGRAQVLSRMGDGEWQVQQDYRTINYDVTAPDSVFATEPPEGYTAGNSKETAPTLDLPRSRVQCGNLACYTPMSFTLGDGSVILAWQSVDEGTDASQEPLFANLTFGGPVPKLPIEFYGLKPAGTSNGVTYTGCHLGHTLKAGQFIEWALYVPDTTPPAAVKYTGYDVLWRFNSTSAPNGGIGLKAMYGVPIVTAEDFDKWVGGAMAELSDTGAAPDQLTYQSVLQLSRQVRPHTKR